MIKRIKDSILWAFKEYRMYRKYPDMKFYNFWEEPIEKNWLYNFIKSRNIPMEKKKVKFFSVFGPLWWLNFHSGKKIFFTGENVHSFVFKDLSKYSDNCIDRVDLSMGFDYIQKNNYIRLPFWLFSLVKPDITFEELKVKIEKINVSSYRLNKHRTQFACHIARHDSNGVRRRMIETLEDIDKIACAGKFMNNTSELYEKYNNEKLLFLRNFRFNICPENSSMKGYITEKIFESIEAGCIPIYWGGEKKEFIEPEILNPEAFIYYEKGKEDILVNKVRELHNSNGEYEDFVRIPPFKEKAPQIIWDKLNRLEEQLRRI